MTPEELRTLTLFNTVESSPDVNQRQLAQELDVSLGLTNTYFQRVLKKGWVRAKQVEARRWLYFLTPQGALEKSRLSLSYMHRTLESFRELKSKGDEHLRILSNKGVSGIHLCGEKDLLADCLQNEKPALPELKSGELILLASLEHRAPLVEFLAQQGLQKNQHWVFFHE